MRRGGHGVDATRARRAPRCDESHTCTNKENEAKERERQTRRRPRQTAPPNTSVSQAAFLDVFLYIGVRPYWYVMSIVTI